MASRFSRPPNLLGIHSPCFARVVEIEHGGDGVHAQSVDVIFVEPEHGARHQEAAHFGASVVEDVSLPVGMKSLARVGVLVEMRAVEVGEAVRVGREVRRHPIEDHADAVLVQVVDQVHEILRRAVARGGREVAGGLISPGAVEGMLHHGQKFDMRESHAGRRIRRAEARFRDRSADDCALRERASRSRDGLHKSIAARAANCVRRASASSRCRSTGKSRSQTTEAVRGGFSCSRPSGIGFVDAVSVALRFDMEFVERALWYAGNEALPDARDAARSCRRCDLRIPVIEAADDRNRARIRRPHAEDGAGFAVRVIEMGAHLVVHAIVAALVEEIEILVGEQLNGAGCVAGAVGVGHERCLVYRKIAFFRALPQRFYGIYLGGAPRREIAGEYGNAKKK